MNRRPLTILLPLVAFTVTAAGCADVSDGDVIATVGDATLDQEQLDEILTLVGGPDLPVSGNADATRTSIGVWLEAHVFTDAFAEAGIEYDQEAIDRIGAGLAAQFPNFTELSTETQDLIVEYSVAIERIPDLPRPDDADTAAWFDGGPQRSGLACVSHILVETEAEADEITAELEAADDGAARFAELAAERSIDPGSAATGGFLSCDAAETISQQFVPTFAQGALDAIPGVPTGPVESDFGFHIIRLGTYAESAPLLEPFFDNFYIQPRVLIDMADTDVDPRYGSATGINVLPLG